MNGKITLRKIIQQRLGDHYLTENLKDVTKDNLKNYEKTIEREQSKFKKILKAYGIDSNVFKVNKQYEFPVVSKSCVNEILDFNLKKTPIHKLNKMELRQEGFNDEQQKEINRLRKVIKKLIGNQFHDVGGLTVAKAITSELGLNELKAEKIITEIIQGTPSIQQRFSVIFDEIKYPDLTLEQRVNIFHEAQIEFEDYLDSIYESIELLL